MTNVAADFKAMRLDNLEQNIRHCWRCSHCKSVPSPKSHAFAHGCPSIEWGGFHPYSGGGKVITAHALQAGEAGYTEEVKSSIYACTMCGACRAHLGRVAAGEGTMRVMGVFEILAAAAALH